MFSGLSEEGSKSTFTDVTSASSPQYGKKDDHFTFREMYGDVNQILESHEPVVTEDHIVQHRDGELITPRTRKTMVDHDQVVITLRKRASALSIDWAEKQYMAPSLARRLRDFEFAQKKRRRKFGREKKWGILGLYDFLSAVREDVAWAEDAAVRRANCLP